MEDMARPTVSPGNVQQAICLTCGGEWFELAGKDDNPDLFKGIGAFQLDGDGRIVAKSGTMICYDCGDIVTLPQASTIPDALDENEMDSLGSSSPNPPESSSSPSESSA